MFVFLINLWIEFTNVVYNGFTIIYNLSGSDPPMWGGGNFTSSAPTMSPCDTVKERDATRQDGLPRRGRDNHGARKEDDGWARG